MNLEFHETIVRLLRSRRVLAVATVVARQGSAPRDFGAKMIVQETGETVFSIGGGAFEALVIEDARRSIREGRGFEKEYRFTEEGQDAVGMVCGGTARVLFEVVRAPEPLLVFGAGHVGREVAHLGVRLGFEVMVIDDRPEYLEAGRFPDAVRRIVAGPGFAGGLPPVPAGAFVAIVTRCHRTDLEALRHVAGRGPAYLGVIGSRRKIATLLRRAGDLGTPAGDLENLRAPIGLPIGAETPQEIAVSIAAEMIAVRRSAAGAASRVTPLSAARAGGALRGRSVPPAPGGPRGE